MAVNAVETRAVSTALAYLTFGISETCYRYERLPRDENDKIADWLLRLTANRKTWGFGLCFLYLRDVKGFEWDHKRVYWIYSRLELNLSIRPLSDCSAPSQMPSRCLKFPTTLCPWTSCRISLQRGEHSGR